jgi:hypothetical protein
MKKSLLSCMLLMGLGVNAQLAPGNIAPNFTFTDTEGTEHTLYDYLDEGKTVILDISAAWCGPCWAYHNTHALRDLYEAHGPTGYPDVSAETTNDVMVFYIEGELTNTGAQITGTSSGNTNATYSQGDWATGTTYPIIDIPSNAAGNAFMNGYEIGYFPTVYMVCPNRIISEPSQQSAANLYALTGDCPEPATAAVDVAAIKYEGATAHCEGSYTPSVKIQNNSTTPLTSATITIMSGATVVSTTNWTGTLGTYEVATVSCTPIATFSGGALTVAVTTTDDANLVNGALATSVTPAIETNNGIMVHVFTDYWANEISWKIKDANGATVPGTTSPALVNNQQQNFGYQLAGTGCYTFSITDGYGDGILNGQTQAGLANGALLVEDSYGTVIMNNIDYGFGKNVLFKATQDVAGVKENAAPGELLVYPNPATDNLTVAFDAQDGDYAVSLVDLQGRVVVSNNYANLSGAQTISVPVANVAKGNYLVKVSSNGTSTVKSVVIK